MYMKLIIITIITLVLCLYLINNKCDELFSQTISDDQSTTNLSMLPSSEPVLATPTPSQTVTYQEELIEDAYEDLSLDLFSSTSEPLPNDTTASCMYYAPTPTYTADQMSVVPTYTPNVCL